jgi:hypothetical protein
VSLPTTLSTAAEAEADAELGAGIDLIRDAAGLAQVLGTVKRCSAETASRSPRLLGELPVRVDQKAIESWVTEDALIHGDGS